MAEEERPPDRPTRGRTGVHRPSARGRSGTRAQRPPPEPEDADIVEADVAPDPDVFPTADSVVDSVVDSDIVDAEVAEDEPAAVAALPAVGTAAVPGNSLSTVESDHRWLDQDAGPVVRPYTLVGGRSRPFTSGLGLLTHVEALYAPDADLVALQPEHRSILSLTRTATSMAELAARLDLPVGVVRVLVGDLIQANLVSTFEADAAVRAPSDDILKAVIDGLRAL